MPSLVVFIDVKMEGESPFKGIFYENKGWKSVRHTCIFRYTDNDYFPCLIRMFLSHFKFFIPKLKLSFLSKQVKYQQ